MKEVFVRRVLIGLFASFFLSSAAAGASDEVLIDCPPRNAPHSIDSPLIDVLLSDAARSAVDREIPAFLQQLPSMFMSTTAPSFASIVTLRSVASSRGIPASSLDRLNGALAALPVTAADSTARCARYDNDRQQFELPKEKVRLLVFQKITGFRDGPSVEAGEASLRAMAKRNGWALVVTEKGGAMTPAILKQFNAVIWNNVSGDVLTLKQRDALKSYIENGGGFVGLHGSGGDPVYFWDWYVDTLIGARFAGHPGQPQFQDAKVVIAEGTSGIAAGLAPAWTMKDEWYSFKSNPRANGARVIATLDESTYSLVEGNRDLRMGDHPIAWTKCIGKGRSFYSAIGHLPQTYSEPHHVKLLEQAIVWSASKGRCEAN